MTTPIVFQITDAGLTAALDAQANGLTLHFTHVGIGTGQYTPTGSETSLQDEIGRWPIGGGGVNAASQTVQFSSSMQSATALDAFEVGVFAEDGTLVGVASTTGSVPLIHITPNVTFIAAMGLSLEAIPTSAVTVSIDPDGTVAQALMGQHLAANNPHPQYANKAANDADHADYEGRITALENRVIEPIKPGGLLLTTNNYADSAAVAAGEGYGEWERLPGGYALVTIVPPSVPTDGIPAALYDMMDTIGSYKHELTVNEMPEHQHGQRADSDGGVNEPQVTNSSGSMDGLRGQTDPASTGKTQVMTDSAGGGQAFSLMQPSFVIGAWRRIDGLPTP